MKRQIVTAALAISIAIIASACENYAPTEPSAVAGVAPTGPGSGVPIAASAAAHHSEQLVFSGKTDNGAIGFWIWCEVDSENPYHDECNGSMSFDSLRLTRHVEDVEDGIMEGPNETYRIMVHSTRDDSVACTLRNTAEPEHGPHNTVTVDCSKPAVSGVSTSAVVNVTGPGD